MMGNDRNSASINNTVQILLWHCRFAQRCPYHGQRAYASFLCLPSSHPTDEGGSLCFWRLISTVKTAHLYFTHSLFRWKFGNTFCGHQAEAGWAFPAPLCLITVILNHYSEQAGSFIPSAYYLKIFLKQCFGGRLWVRSIFFLVNYFF